MIFLESSWETGLILTSGRTFTSIINNVYSVSRSVMVTCRCPKDKLSQLQKTIKYCKNIYKTLKRQSCFFYWPKEAELWWKVQLAFNKSRERQTVGTTHSGQDKQFRPLGLWKLNSEHLGLWKLKPQCQLFAWLAWPCKCVCVSNHLGASTQLHIGLGGWVGVGVGGVGYWKLG